MKRLLILLMLVSQPVWAGWVEWGRTEGGQTIFYDDPATLRKTANGRRIWMMVTYDSPNTQGGVTHRSGRWLYEFDCAGERARGLQQELFSGPILGGSSVFEAQGPGNWEVPAPRTFAENHLKAVCRMPLK